MLVTCTAATGKELPASCLDPRLGITLDTEFPLTVGVSYVVYAITIFHGHCWYYVFDDNRLPYPVWKLAVMFEISDPSLPGDWVVGSCRKNQQDEGYVLISFLEWALDPNFYEHLVDGDAVAVRIFRARRESAET